MMGHVVRPLRDVIAMLSEIPDDNPPTIYAKEPWTPDSEAILLPWRVPTTNAPAGFAYFLEVELAKEAIEVWSAWRAGAKPSIDEATRAVLYYALLGPAGSGVGDRHLAAMAKPYGRIMNGGVSSVLDTCSPEDVERAAEAFAYLGLNELAEVTRWVAHIEWYWRAREIRLNRAFYGLEHGLEAAFRRRYAGSPEDFDAVEGAHETAEGAPICAGDLVVHEVRSLCSLGEDCAGVPNHATARLHRAQGCELCPAGPDWPT
jgi:hypothetical protein